jgi:hypothetical protein
MSGRRRLRSARSRRGRLHGANAARSARCVGRQDRALHDLDPEQSVVLRDRQSSSAANSANLPGTPFSVCVPRGSKRAGRRAGNACARSRARDRP